MSTLKQVISSAKASALYSSTPEIELITQAVSAHIRNKATPFVLESPEFEPLIREFLDRLGLPEIGRPKEARRA